MKKLLSVILLLISFDAIAKMPDIVAVVNDKPITLFDFEARRKMAIIHNNIDTSNPAVNARLNHDVLNVLIEEELLNQHAEKVGGKIGEAEIANAIAIIEERNKMSKGHLIPYLKNQGINIDSFKAQLRGELIKYNIISSLSNSVSVSPKEFDVAIINAAAKDFDINAWIFTSKNNDDKTYAEMQKLKKHLLSCKNIEAKLYSNFATGEKFEGKISALPVKTQSIVKDADVGTASSIYEEGEQFKVALVCEKKIAELSSADQTQIKAFLSNKKMSRKAEKFFKDLKAKAYIKINLPGSR
jgi:hypothetical protein